MSRLPPMLMMHRCINSRRIKRGGGPVRYTGWTVPTYNQSPQQYGYTNDQNAYNTNTYPQGPYPPGQYPPTQQGQYSYQGPPQAGNTGPAYYDATQTSAEGSVLMCSGTDFCRRISTARVSSSCRQANEFVSELAIRIRFD